MLKGKKSAPTSPTPGFTKGVQFIRISKKIMLIDSPGIIPWIEKNELLMVLLSAKNPQQLKELELTGIELGEIFLKNNKKEIENFYEIKAKNGEDLLEKIALKRKRLKKGGIPDLNASSTILINDYQKGKLSLS